MTEALSRHEPPMIRSSTSSRGRERRQIALQLGEVVGVQHDPVLHDLGKAGAELALGQGPRHGRIDDDEPRLVERADHVLSERVVDGRLASDEASTCASNVVGSCTKFDPRM